MWIFEMFPFERSTSWRRRALEAVVLAVLIVGVPAFAWPRAFAAVEPHPGWLAVLVLSARYGTDGFFLGLGAVSLVGGVVSLITGHALATAWGRLDALKDGAALGASLLVSWVGSWHLQKENRLSERLREASDRAAQAERTIEALRGVTARLRSRVDRTSNSLTFLRDVADRLHGADPVAAAEGAADLAVARTGAHGVVIRVGTRGFERQLAIRDLRGPDRDEPLTNHAPDVVVPVRIENERAGYMACWGVPKAALDEATMNDLDVIACWYSRSLAAGVRPAPNGKAPFVRTPTARVR